MRGSGLRVKHVRFGKIGVPSSEWSLFGKKKRDLGVYRHVFSEHKFKLGFWAEPYPQDTLKTQKCARFPGQCALFSGGLVNHQAKKGWDFEELPALKTRELAGFCKPPN